MKVQSYRFILFVLVLCSCRGMAPSSINPSVEPATLAATLQPFVDTSYYEGIVVITQYYTFLGHGLHEEAYWLLSRAAQNPINLDEYLKNTHIAFKTVEIISIQPYYEAVSQWGGQTTPDPGDRKRFIAKIRAWGEGNMSGSVGNGDLQLIFLTLVLEDDQWKIDSFSTAPLP